MLLFGWIGTGGTSFLLGDQWVKDSRALACYGGKRTLPQIHIPIWLLLPSHIKSQQRSNTLHVAKLIGTIGAAKEVLTLKKSWVLKIGRSGSTYLFLQCIWSMSSWHTKASLGSWRYKMIFTMIWLKRL